MLFILCKTAILAKLPKAKHKALNFKYHPKLTLSDMPCQWIFFWNSLVLSQLASFKWLKVCNLNILMINKTCENNWKFYNYFWVYSKPQNHGNKKKALPFSDLAPTVDCIVDYQRAQPMFSAQLSQPSPPWNFGWQTIHNQATAISHNWWFWKTVKYLKALKVAHSWLLKVTVDVSEVLFSGQI